MFIWDLSFFLRQAFITINFPLSTPFPEAHKFWNVVFPFSFVLRYFCISIFNSSLSYCLLRSIFYLHKFVNFPVSSCYSFLLYTTVIGRDTRYDFNLFKSVKTYFVIYCMIYPEVFSSCPWGKNVNFAAIWWTHFLLVLCIK